MCDYSFVMQSFSRFLANIAVKRFVDAICFCVLESLPIWALSRRVVALLSAQLLTLLSSRNNTVGLFFSSLF